MTDISLKKMEILERTSDILIPDAPLDKLLNSDKQLRIKYGVDVTAPFLHLGHAVNLWYMRILQEAGHKVVFLIGDFTTSIGDPTGKSTTRPVIPQEEIEKNSEEFIKQVSTILKTDQNVFEIRRNSEWYGNMPSGELLKLFSMVNYSTLTQRDMFQKRMQEGKEIRMHEMIYPILQGYDSYMLEADLTIVGNDQMFNEKMGRFYQKKLGMAEQAIITTKITPGLDGVHKQSKSLNNYIAIADAPRDKFGKVMSLPDNLIVDYMKVYTEMSNAAIAQAEREMTAGKNPSLLKKDLAKSIVSRYHGDNVAEQEYTWFNDTFSKKRLPDNIPEVTYLKGETSFDIVRKLNAGKSKSEIARLFQQGAVRINDVKVTEISSALSEDMNEQVLKIGKKSFYKLKSKPQTPQ